MICTGVSIFSQRPHVNITQTITVLTFTFQGYLSQNKTMLDILINSNQITCHSLVNVCPPPLPHPAGVGLMCQQSMYICLLPISETVYWCIGIRTPYLVISGINLCLYRWQYYYTFEPAASLLVIYYLLKAREGLEVFLKWMDHEEL